MIFGPKFEEQTDSILVLPRRTHQVKDRVDDNWQGDISTGVPCNQ